MEDKCTWKVNGVDRDMIKRIKSNSMRHTLTFIRANHERGCSHIISMGIPPSDIPRHKSTTR